MCVHELGGYYCYEEVQNLFVHSFTFGANACAEIKEH